MIKRYNDFINEEFVMGQPSTKPTTAPTREIERRQAPTRPSIIPSKKPGVEDAPLAEFDQDEYVGEYKIKELASKLGPDAILKGNSIDYKGQKVNYFSETEKIHIGKKKFDSIDDVYDYLTNSEENIDPEFEARNYRLSKRHKRLK